VVTTAPTAGPSALPPKALTAPANATPVAPAVSVVVQGTPNDAHPMTGLPAGVFLALSEGPLGGAASAGTGAGLASLAPPRSRASDPPLTQAVSVLLVSTFSLHGGFDEPAPAPELGAAFGETLGDWRATSRRTLEALSAAVDWGKALPQSLAAVVGAVPDFVSALDAVFRLEDARPTSAPQAAPEAPAPVEGWVEPGPGPDLGADRPAGLAPAGEFGAGSPASVWGWVSAFGLGLALGTIRGTRWWVRRREGSRPPGGTLRPAAED
jgi:hypothetical protein